MFVLRFQQLKTTALNEPPRESLEEVFFSAVLHDPRAPKSSQVTGSGLPSPRRHLLALWALNAGHPLTFLLRRSATRDRSPPRQLCQPHPWQLPLPTEGQRVALMSGHIMSQQQPPGAALTLHHVLTCWFLLDASASIKICSESHRVVGKHHTDFKCASSLT